MADPGKRIIEADYDERFLSEYLGSVKENPSIAIIEIIANSWDAGAEHVSVSWPEVGDENGRIVIEDDGCGMTREEFEARWPTASYNRSKTQSPKVRLSDGNERTVFGSNGVGRFGMFCFSDEYSVETWKGGEFNEYVVTTGKPYTIEWMAGGPRDGNGTRIECVRRGLSDFISQDNLMDLVRKKFYGRVKFAVSVN